MNKIHKVFKKIFAGHWVLVFAFFALTAQVGYRYVRPGSSRTVGSATCWSAAYTINDCAAGAPVGGSGTADRIVKFTAASTIGNSSLIDAGVPAASASGDIIDLTATLNIANGSDTISAYDIALTNANHTGTGNTVNGINIAAITGDADATENGINIGTGWDVALDASNGLSKLKDVLQTGFYGIRDNLSTPQWHAGVNWGAYSTADTSVNLITSAQGYWYHIRNEQASTIALWIMGSGTDYGYLNIDGDNIDNEGGEIVVGNETTGTFAMNGGVDYGYLRCGTDSRYFEVKVRIDDISETDQFVIGWRLATEAFQDASLYTAYDTWFVLGLTDAAGDIDGLAEADAAGTQNDDSGVTWADTNEKTLRVAISAAGAATFTVDGATFTQTNTGALTCDANESYVPFVSFLDATGDGTPDPGIFINYFEIGIN